VKITIESHGGTFSWENEGDDTNLAELIPQIKGLLVSVGYHPKSVDECFSPDEFEWFPEVGRVEDYLKSEGFEEQGKMSAKAFSLSEDEQIIRNNHHHT
jgi:hypothetical protein